MPLPSNFAEKFWAKDTSAWSNGKYGPSIPEFMGWIHIAETMLGRAQEINDFVAEAKASGIQRVILAGMGGSSLAPLVFSECIPAGEGLEVDVLDSTDPETILRIERRVDLRKTICIIASKSGSTAEPNAFNDYLYARTQMVTGDSVGNHFVAITDPGSPFQARAEALKFRKIFLNFPDIGGRYSALSYFGLVPAACAGINITTLLERAVESVKANASSAGGPAFSLGAKLGDFANQGRDKLTFLTPASLATVGLWMEQLIAESTGKEGRGVLPIAKEPIGAPENYGKDRVFASFQLHGNPDGALTEKIAALKGAGFPVIEQELRDPYDIGKEMMEWEIATATIGAVIQINPFDQPNVQESKDITKRYVAKVEESGSLPPETPDATDGELQIFNQTGDSFFGALNAFLGKVEPGDYICLQSYLTETPEFQAAVERLVRHLRDTFKVAVTHGYGPRFLHSTGQFHKGGPNTGHFIQFTQDDNEDMQLPGKKYTFGVFRNAQAIGDREALIAHDRRVIRVHLGKVPAEGVAKVVVGLGA